MNSINFKETILNQIMIKGKKQTSEKLFLKCLKTLQKSYKKKSSDLIKLSTINSAPVIYLKYIRRKRKKTVEFPFLLKPNLRIYYGIKFILNTCKLKKNTTFYTKLKLEIINSSKNVSESVNHKFFIHRQSFLKKKFSNYRWF